MAPRDAAKDDREHDPWRIVRWAIEERGLDADRVADAFARSIAAARAALARSATVDAFDGSPFGVLGARSRRALHLDTLRRIEELASTLVV